MRFTILFFLFISSIYVDAQKYVSVVESFVNTGDSDANQVITALKSHAEVADTSDLNRVYIQYHVDKNYNDWSDNLTLVSNNDRYNAYLNLGIVDSICDVAKNGAAQTSGNWYDCSPEDKYIYSTGAKKITVIYEGFNAADSTVIIRWHTARKFSSSSDAASVHVVLLENNIQVNVTGGENAGSSFTMNNVARDIRIQPADIYSDTVHLKLPSGTDYTETSVVAFVQDDTTKEVYGGTRGIRLQPYIEAPGNQFAVVEEFVNTGCYGGPSAIASMTNYATIAESSPDNDALVQLHIGQVYGNWSDMYKMQINTDRYDTYSWDMGILAGLAAVAKNGIRYKPHSWNSCEPLRKTAISFVDLQYDQLSDTTLTVDYDLYGELGNHDRVYIYAVESGISVHVTGGEIPGTMLNMSNVARAVRIKPAVPGQDTAVLHIPGNADLSKVRILAYIQNDVTYDVSGGTKGFTLSDFLSVEEVNRAPKMTIYPNPTAQEINLQFDRKSISKSTIVSVYSLEGKQVYSKSFDALTSIISIADHGLDPGMYVVRVEVDNDEVLLGKVTVQ